jgi:hypothetical protein
LAVVSSYPTVAFTAAETGTTKVIAGTVTATGIAMVIVIGTGTAAAKVTTASSTLL